jgi:predicted nucleotidyltransferase
MKDKIINILTNFSFNGLEILGLGLLGSIARGDYSYKSDIDIFVIINDKDWRYGLEDEIRKRLYEYLSEFKRDITLFLYTLSDLKMLFGVIHFLWCVMLNLHMQINKLNKYSMIY